MELSFRQIARGSFSVPEPELKGFAIGKVLEMKPEELTRKLNSVGKRIFIAHYDLFKDYAQGRLPRNVLIRELVRLGVSNEAGAAIRVGNAKLIFEAHKEMEAIAIILKSERIPLSTRLAAQKLQN